MSGEGPIKVDVYNRLKWHAGEQWRYTRL